MAMTTLEIVRGISQVLGKLGHDGAYDDDQKLVDIGLKRNEGNPINDSRVVDGFSVKFQGDKLIICYQSDIKMKDVHDPRFEADVVEMIDKVAAFIRKEYKKHTGEGLQLSAVKEIEPRVIVQNLSRVRNFVMAEKVFRIGGIPSEVDEPPQIKDLEKALKVWGTSSDAKRPSNEKIKKTDNQKKKINEDKSQFRASARRILGRAKAIIAYGDLTGNHRVRKDKKDKPSSIDDKPIKIDPEKGSVDSELEQVHSLTFKNSEKLLDSASRIIGVKKNTRVQSGLVYNISLIVDGEEVTLMAFL